MHMENHIIYPNIQQRNSPILDDITWKSSNFGRRVGLRRASTDFSMSHTYVWHLMFLVISMSFHTPNSTGRVIDKSHDEPSTVVVAGDSQSVIPPPAYVT